MTEVQQELWARLNAYELDAVDSKLPFSKRLARENNWTVHYAKSVMNEYKRFVFLALTSSHPVTPSDEIDQVWHLHLIYTKAYWEDFCKNVIRTPFHHHPTKGGKAEGDKFRGWYAKTKQSYREVFGKEPPSDIWRNERERFALAPHYKRINTAANWIIPKPMMRKNVVTIVVLIMSVSTVRCVGDAVLIDKSQLGMIIGFVLLAVLLGGILFAFNGQAKETENRDGGSGTGCNGSIDASGDSESDGGDSGSGCGGCGGCGS